LSRATSPVSGALQRARDARCVRPISQSPRSTCFVPPDRTAARYVERASAELEVGAATPPLFVVHAFDDEAVPIENSLRLLEAMRTAQRPVEAHLLQEGGHAFGTGYPDTPSAQWVELFDAWWRRLGGTAGAP
jgi:dipeptidyl aminopeptidase/acylaminoacyl peptidase